MKKNLIYIFSLLTVAVAFSSCLKSNDFWEDFSSITPIADLPKAPVNAATAANPTTMVFENSTANSLDSAAGPADYKTAVHLSAKDHLGDVTIKMMVDVAVGQTWVAAHPTYQLLPADLYTVVNPNVVIPNAGVFSVGDFIVNIKANADDGTGVSRFKNKKYVLPVSIADASPYGIASQYKTIIWNVQVKLK